MSNSQDTHQPFAKSHFHHLLVLCPVSATATKDQRLLLLFCFLKLTHIPHMREPKLEPANKVNWEM